MLNFPLMLRYKAKLGCKLAIEGSFGPSFILFTSKVRGEFSGKGDFEAILTQNDNGEYDDYTSNYVEDKTDLILKDEEINANLFMESSGYSNQNANVLFNELNAKEGFDLGVEREIRRSNSTGTRSGLAINAGLDLFYHIMPTIAVKIGSTFTITPNIKNSNVNYEPIKGSNNEFFCFWKQSQKQVYFIWL